MLLYRSQTTCLLPHVESVLKTAVMSVQVLHQQHMQGDVQALSHLHICYASDCLDVPVHLFMYANVQITVGSRCGAAKSCPSWNPINFSQVESNNLLRQCVVAMYFQAACQASLAVCPWADSHGIWS